MINLPLGSAAPSQLRSGIRSGDPASSPQSNLDLKARNPEVIERAPQGGIERGPQGGIAGLVQLNLSMEEAIAQAAQIKSLLSQQFFSIANESPEDIAVLMR